VGAVGYTLAPGQRVRVTVVLHGSMSSPSTLALSFAPDSTPAVVVPVETTGTPEPAQAVAVTQSAPSGGGVFVLNVFVQIALGVGTLTVDSPSSYAIVEVLST